MSFLTNPPSFASFPDFDSEPGPSKPEEQSKHRSRSPRDKSRKDERKSHKGDEEHRARKHRDESRTSSRERRNKRDSPHESHKKRERKEHKPSRLRDTEVVAHEREPVRRGTPGSNEPHSHPFENDERLKAEEDARRKGDSTTFDLTSSTQGYYSDKRGDPLNVQYGRLDSKQVPNYRHVGGGRFILGLSRGWRVMYRSSQGVEVGRSNEMFGRKIGSLTDPKSRAMLKAPPVQRLIFSEHSANNKYQEVDGFIRLRTRNRPSTPPYKTIEPMADASDSDPDASASSASESSEDEGGSAPLSTYQERLIEFERRTKDLPTSAAAWLALLSHMLSQYPITAPNAVKARSETTLSVLSRALASAIPNTQTTNLRLRYLQAGEEIWPPERLAEEWKKALQASSADLRIVWLEWKIRKAEGGVDGVLEDALQALSALPSEMDRLRVFWRTAVFLRRAGFTERAVALFQAQAELIHNTPQSLENSPLEAQLDSLEEFWEAEVLRVGESGARGWNAWVAAGKPDAPAPVTSSRQTPAPAPVSDPYERWAHDELAADRVLLPPLRSADPASELDPYSTILFSDVRLFLFQLTGTRGKNAFRLVWLSVLGLSVPGLPSLLSPQATTTGDDRWCEGHLTSTSFLDRVFPPPAAARRVTADAHAGALVGREEQYDSSFGPVKHWTYRVLGPFEGMDFAPGAGWPLWTAADVRDVDADLARNVFAVCRTGPDDVEWDNLALAFEAALSPKGAVKRSQAFLAESQDSLPRWATHARLERLRARPAAARKVYETVLTAPFSGGANRLGTGPLWWDWAEMEWLSGDASAALRAVLRAAGLDASANASASAGAGGGVAVLRARQALEETARGIPTVLWKVREAWTKLGALLELLAGATSLPSFIAAAPADHTNAGTGSAAEGESGAVAALGMLYHHVVTLRGTTRPAELRARLERAVEVYADNTAILGMYLEMQKGQSVWGRVRDLLTGGDGGSERSVARRVADVWIAGWERGRWGWELERTRTGLEAAVSSERTRGSAVLWRVYLELEIRAGDLRRAKDVFFRAIGQCPLVKELYTVAFSRLRSVLTEAELDGLGETMAERGLRTRASLEDAVEGWAAPEKSEDSDDSGDDIDEKGGEDEIEYQSRELARLKPY